MIIPLNDSKGATRRKYTSSFYSLRPLDTNDGCLHDMEVWQNLMVMTGLYVV